MSAKSANWQNGRKWRNRRQGWEKWYKLLHSGKQLSPEFLSQCNRNLSEKEA